MTSLGFGVFDSDNDYYEHRDALRHLAPAMADRAVKIVTDAMRSHRPRGGRP